MEFVFDEDFVPEIEENIEGFESVFLDLSGESISEESLNKIAFYAHNFKGSSQIAGLEELAKYLHEFENVLGSLKKNEITWNDSVCEFFFKWIDTLKEFGKSYAKKELKNLDINWIIKNHEAFLNEDESVEQNDNRNATKDVNVLVNEDESKSKDGNTDEEKDKEVKQPEFIRTNIEKLDSLLNFVGELVINQAVLNNYKENNQLNERKALDTIEYLNKIVNDISHNTLSLRMVPLKQFFQKVKRIARDVSKIQGKSVNIVLSGEEVELDKTIVDKMTDPIIHIIKNAIDHGIESNELRLEKGKPVNGTLKVRAVQKESVAEIYIEDDGGGINKERVIEKALEKGIITNESELTEEQIFNLIFHPGFSTASQVTEISGRGVGMDVVKKVIDSLQGNILIKSSPEGSIFKLTIPLSLSIINGMIIKVGGENYIVPVSQLQETIELKNFKVEYTGKGRVLNLRGNILPIISMERVLNHRAKVDNKTEFQNEKALVVLIDGERISFEVDEIVEQQQIVVKKFGTEMENIPGLSGGAILSDGEPGIILNLQEMFSEGAKHG